MIAVLLQREGTIHKFKTVGCQESTVHRSQVQRPTLQRGDARILGVIMSCVRAEPRVLLQDSMVLPAGPLTLLKHMSIKRDFLLIQL